VIAFARVAPEDATEAIAGALSDPDASIRYIAIRIAEEQGETERIVARLSDLLKDADGSVRVAAAIALARAGDDRGAGVLLDVVARRLKVREADDEAAAVQLVGEMGLRAAIPYLERRAFGVMARLGRDAFAFQSLVALARMGHERASSRILSDLGARSRDRRTLAVAAAGMAKLFCARPLIEAMRGDEARAEQDAVAEALEALVPRADLQFPERERDLP
jgi:HEAT repeat protein